MSDDAGYADFSLHGSNHFPTPNIDRIAETGIRFSQGYVSASVCSPSRAGLMTGRYQQRFGHHHNPPPRYSETIGLPLDETTLADVLKGRGYRTIAVGKWHLGHAPEFHPLARGFDDFYGFLHGARSYFALSDDQRTRADRMLRNRKPVPETFEYLTDALGREAAAYIDAHAQAPFFLYLAFNAPHYPLHASPAKLEQASSELTAKRRKLAAMTMSLDDAVGAVMGALDRNGIADNTLLVFLNDNGGESWAGLCDNSPLRGRKGQPYEGGIRVPFVARWPDRWPVGEVYDHPVSALDVFPTALAAAGGDVSAQVQALDGVDLTPVLTGATGSPPHQTLFWKRQTNFAVRHDDWKLLRHATLGHRRELVSPATGAPLELYNIAVDPSETNDVAAQFPEVVAQLRALYEVWQASHAGPRW